MIGIDLIREQEEGMGDIVYRLSFSGGWNGK